MTITAYLRVSTDAQDQQSQQRTIAEWSERTNRKIDASRSDHASGATPWRSRAIAGILDASAPGDTIVVAEISRIARSILGVLSFLEAAAERQVEVVAIRSGIILDKSMASKITVTVLALAAEVERDLIRERTKAALQARKAAGLPLGRPIGSRSASIIADRGPEIDKLLEAGVSKRAIARVLDCAPNTLYAYLASREQTED